MNWSDKNEHHSIDPSPFYNRNIRQTSIRPKILHWWEWVSICNECESQSEYRSRVTLPNTVWNYSLSAVQINEVDKHWPNACDQALTNICDGTGLWGEFLIKGPYD